MWVQPTILAPAKGFSVCARFLSEISADMSENMSGRDNMMQNTLNIHNFYKGSFFYI